MSNGRPNNGCYPLLAIPIAVFFLGRIYFDCNADRTFFEMKKIILILILLTVATSCGWLKGGDKSQIDAPFLQVYSDVQERTPNGILLASKNGTTEEFKTIADASLNEVFADASALGYQDGLNFSQYIIYVLDNCTPSPVTQTPSFRLRSDSYDGTIFDQDPRPGIGYILASEYVFPESNGVSTNYVICSDIANAANNVRYGAEHIILWQNNPAEFERTKFHGNGIYHPIIPQRTQ